MEKEKSVSTLDDCKKNIQEFANKNKVVFEDEGEVGIGRECVGLLMGGNYVNYNPHNSETYEEMPEYYDDRLNAIAPEDAYHKHQCIAVLGRGEEAIRQLSDWVDKLKELGATIEQFPTGAKGMQALFSGVFAYTIKLPK